MEIVALRALRDNYIYMWIKDGLASAVDPGEAAPVLKFLGSRGLKLNSIFLTHHHNDHIGGVPELLAHSPVAVFCSKYDQPRIPGVTGTFEGGDEFDVFGEKVKVIAVPGHTNGQIAYYFPRLQALFPGDTLFSAGCGRLFEGTMQEMHSSLTRLKQLPPSTKIYFGHEYTVNNLKFVLSRENNSEVQSYLHWAEQQIAAGHGTTPTTIERELKVNPFLAAHDLATFTEWRTARNSW